MRRFFAKLFLAVGLAVCCFGFYKIVFATSFAPSFEFYSEHSYPTVEDAYAIDASEYVYFTAKITDDSGVYSAVAILSDTSGEEIDRVAMTDDGDYQDGSADDNVYGAAFNISDLGLTGTYNLSIIAIDNLYNSSEDTYENITQVTIRAETCEISGDMKLCIKKSVDIPSTVSKFLLYNSSGSETSSISLGNSVTMKATLSSAMEGQTVYFRDSNFGNLIGSSATDEYGVATYTYTPSFSGNHTLQAIYKGNNFYNLAPSYKMASLSTSGEGNCSTSGDMSLCITSAYSNPTTISSFKIYNSDEEETDSISAGEAVIIAAQLSSAVSGQTIYFKDSTVGTLLGSAETDANGLAVYYFYASFSGTHTLQAIYKGNGFYGLSPSYKIADLYVSGNCLASGDMSLCISDVKAKDSNNNIGILSSTTLLSSDASSETGDYVTFTATVTSGATGSVVFKDGTTTLGTATLNSSGVATYATSSLSSGYHTITAVYAGDSNYLGSTSNEIVQLVTAPLSNWAYYQQITISHEYVDANLTNFPLLVKFTNSSVAAYAKSDGSDIIFADDDGNQLSFERESYSSGTGIFWVKVPTISSSENTTIYMYYGNSSAGDMSSASNVWDSNYIGVWHMGTSSIMSTEDSTSNSNDGVNNSVTAVSGKVGGAGYLDGSSAYIGTSLDTQPSAMSTTTWEAWIYPTSTSGSQSVFTNDDGGYDRGVESTRSSDGNFNIFTGYGTWTPVSESINNWQHVALAYSSNNIYFYKNGAQYNYGSASSGQSTNNKFNIGRNPGYGEYFSGDIDEVRVSNSVRSAAWIKFEYYNMASDGNQLIFGGTPQLSISASPASIMVGGSTTLTATLLSGSGTVLSGEAISFADTTSGVSIGSATTNSSGVATITYSTSSSISTGSHTITATFTGDTSLGITSGSATTSITVSTKLYSAWSYYKAIVISKTEVSSDLTNFPLLVKFSSDTSVGAHANSSGTDIIFADANGNQLSFERESFSVSSGAATGIFWVKVPTISSSVDTTIYMYYGNSSAGDMSSSNAWDSSYKGVWHLGGDGSNSGVTSSQTVSEGSTATLSCSSGTILSYTSLYGSNCSACNGGASCGSCTIGSSSCSVTYNNSNCGDCASGCAKSGYLSITCEGEGLSAVDSTSSSNDGTNGGDVSVATGKIGGAASFPQTSTGHLSVADSDSLNMGTGDWQVDFWMNGNDQTNCYSSIFGSYNNGSWGSGDVDIRWDDDCTSSDGGSNAQNISMTYYGVGDGALYSSDLSFNTWYYVVVNRTGSTLKVYVDGILNNTTTSQIFSDTTFDWTLNGYPLYIGGSWDSNSQGGYNGLLDELRVSNSVRSAAWIKFEYYNMNSSNNEITLGSQTAN